jgi:hypothetical protein
LFLTAGLERSTESKIKEKHSIYTASSLRPKCGLHEQKRFENFSNSNDKYELRSLGASILEKNRLNAVGKN